MPVKQIGDIANAAIAGDRLQPHLECRSAGTTNANHLARAAIVPGIVALAIILLTQQACAADDAVRAYSSSAFAPHQGPVSPATIAADDPAKSRRHAYFGSVKVSSEARHFSDWIVDSADNVGLPFIVVDKKNAHVYLFDPGGRLQGESPALLGLARGDLSVPGIGDRAYADMPPETRTTPAGRFVAEMGINAQGSDIVWVDYDAAVSLHRVATANVKEHRLRRLATTTILDNRITYGCINVPVRFYETAVSPAFTGKGGIVYVLPEVLVASDVFAAYAVEERRRIVLETHESQIVTESTRE